MTATTASASPKALSRLLLLALLLCLIGVALYVLFFTSLGERIREDPRRLGREFRQWVDAHKLIAPLTFIGIYVIATLCLLPVWWLQVLAGIAFGLWLGVAYSLAGAILAAMASVLVSRTLLADYIR